MQVRESPETGAKTTSPMRRPPLTHAVTLGRGENAGDWVDILPKPVLCA